MTDTYIPTEEQLDQSEPQDDEVVIRESDDGVELRINIVSGASVNGTNAKTYTDAFGHYFIDSNSQATEDIDDLISEFSTDNAVIDSFGRRIGQSYEVSVQIDPDISETNYTYERTNKITIEIPSHSKYMDYVDQTLHHINDDI